MPRRTPSRPTCAQLLVRQLASPVRWPDTLRALAQPGIAQVIECGPGKVLTGLNRRIEKRADLELPWRSRTRPPSRRRSRRPEEQSHA